MVLNNVTKFHKILIKSIRLREGTSLDRSTYVSKYRQMDRVTLNARPLSWRGHKNKMCPVNQRLAKMKKVNKQCLLDTPTQ